eukprot:SAG31_NODE_13743_length_850_cov_0.688415_1_plen_230_part_10
MSGPPPLPCPRPNLESQCWTNRTYELLPAPVYDLPPNHKRVQQYTNEFAKQKHIDTDSKYYSPDGARATVPEDFVFEWSNGYAWPGNPEDHVDDQGTPHPDQSMWECLWAPDERFGKWYKEPVKYPQTNRRRMWYGNGTWEGTGDQEGKWTAGTWEDGARPGQMASCVIEFWALDHNGNLTLQNSKLEDGIARRTTDNQDLGSPRFRQVGSKDVDNALMPTRIPGCCGRC